MRQVEVRLYAGLNDFLPLARRGRALRYALFGAPAVKDVLEALGVPHPEVAFLLIDGAPAGFGQRLVGGERVAAYPEPGGLAFDPALRVSPAPQAPPRFLLDGHLATLAASLRLFGFDAELPRPWATARRPDSSPGRPPDRSSSRRSRGRCRSRSSTPRSSPPRSRRRRSPRPPDPSRPPSTG